MPDAGAVGVRVIPDFGGFGALFSGGIRNALGQAEGLGKELSAALGGGVKTGVTLGVAGAAIAITDFVTKGVQEYDRLAETTRELEHITGAGAEQTSLFAGVLRHLGVDADAAGRPLGILANNIQNHTELFAKYGVQIARTSTGQADLLGTLDNLRKSFSSSADATQRDAAAKALLGRGFQTLLPYLALTNTQYKQFQDIARRSGEVFSPADLDNARQMAVNMAMAKSEIESVKLALGRAGTSGVNDFFSGLNVLSKTGVGDIPRVAANLTGLGEIFGVKLPDHIRQAVSAENDLSRQHEALKQAGLDAADATDKLGTAIEGVHSAEEGVQSSQQGVQHAAEGITRAQEGVQKAHEGAHRAAEGLGTAERNLSDLLAKGAVDAKAVESAQQGLESANRGVRTSVESLATAQEHLTELQAFAAVDAAHELTAAHLSLADATLNLAQARLSLGTTRPTLQDPFAQQRARLAVAHATEQQKQAQENLAKTTQFGTAADKGLTDAQRQVRDASQRVTDSLDAQADAQKKLTEAQAGDPQFQQKVAAAKQQVADAGLSVRDAQLGERDAGLSLRDAQQSFATSNQSLVDAKIKLRDATDKVNAELDAENAKGVNSYGILDGLKVQYPELAGLIEQFYSRVKTARDALGSPSTPGLPAYTGQIPGAITGPVPANNPFGPAYYNPPGRASGGDVRPGQAYLVGERGPEILQDGRVYPRGQAPPAVGAAAGDTFHYHFNFPNYMGTKDDMVRLITQAQNQHRRATRGRQ